MPYCPKCDMEFINGITACSDCGGPLVESEAAAKALKEEANPENVGLERNYGNAEYDMADDFRLVNQDEEFTSAGVYVKKADKYEEMKSSASAFLLVGSVILGFSLLCWLRIINLPMTGLSKMLFQSILTIMGIVFLLVCIFTYKSANSLSSQIEEENKKTAELVNWFSENYTGTSLDQQLAGELKELSPEELSLKRFELIQDILITNHDLTNQSYVDSLSEDVYSRLYESS